MNSRARSVVIVVALLTLGLCLGGCLERKLKPLNPCLVSGVVAEIAVTNIDKVDLLFMVDNSGSMREEQEALRREFPNLIRVLTTGDRDGDGVNDFPPAKDLHLGVVSSNMGLAGITEVGGCEGLGDDGIMNNKGDTSLGNCQATYPRFLTYTSEVNDPMQVATDFGCIASLGTEGCGFEQQLEAGLKALWPSMDRDPSTGEILAQNRITFLGDPNGFGTLGHGDVENAGFLRNDPVMGISLIAIIMVTDEEDCSSSDTTHFTPPQFLDPNSQLAMQDLNLRCFYNPQNLYMLERYVNGFKALRPGNENLVIFGAIVGVPTDLVDEEARAGVDFSDMAQREAYYDRILNDTRMMEVVDTSRPADQAQNLVPSCLNDNDGDGSPESRAYPPRRFVEVARRFGENGVVQSICQSSFAPAMDAIIEVIAKQLGAVCLPRPLVRNSDGLVGCNVVWELPPSNFAPSGTPTSCDMRDFLEPPDPGREAVTKRGGQVCKVSQLPVVGQQVDQTLKGWFYDDFSDDVKKECTGESKQRVTFTNDAKPPTGVTVKLECLNETQSLANNRTDIAKAVVQPTIGDPCEMVPLQSAAGTRSPLADLNSDDVLTGDEACIVILEGQELDTSMLCHPELNVCVLSCSSDADCPAAWVCDSRPDTLASTVSESRENGSPICVNPTCGDL